MNKEIVMAVEAVSGAKGVDADVIYEAIEAALAAAVRRKLGEDTDIRIKINRTSGDYTTYRRYLVVNEDDFTGPDRQMKLDDALKLDSSMSAEATLEQEIPNIPLGRVSAQTARQVILQKVREAEREQVAEHYRERIGELITGVVKRYEKGGVVVELGANAEAVIPKENLVPNEILRKDDRVRAYLEDVRDDPKGPQLIATRTSPEFLIELFKLEVPEVGQGAIEIKGAARDPGIRAKIAVKSYDARVDPVGACVGMRGSRVQTISRELNEEKIDVILWDDEPIPFVINAMAPAEIVHIVLDEESHSMDIAVTESKLAQAIGRGGQNVRLASELIGWTLNIMTEAQAATKNSAETEKLTQYFIAELDIDEDLADILVEGGFSSIEEIAYLPAQEFLSIDGMDEEVISALRERARDSLLTKAIAEEERDSGDEVILTLNDLEDMNDQVIKALAQSGITTLDDLAEWSADELAETCGLEYSLVEKWVMTARQPWFNQ